MHSERNFEQIDVDKAKEMIEHGPVTIVDVRREDDYLKAHIKGAVLVTDKNIDEFLSQTDRNKPLICYCYHGFSSQSACAFFQQSGFSQVLNVKGGFEAWKLNQ